MKNILSSILLVSSTILICCGEEVESQLPQLIKIEIQSSNGAKLELNATTKLTVIGTDQFGAPLVISSTPSWTADNDNISIDLQGNATAKKIGSTVVMAKIENISDTINLEIIWDTGPQTKIYVSDAGANFNGPYQILRYDENGKNPEVFIDDNLAWPQDILFIENQGIVLISNLNSGSINRHDASTSTFISTFASGWGGPTRMKIGPDRLLYVLQWQGDGKVLKFQLDGTALPPFTTVGVKEGIGLDWDAAGNLYVSSFNNGQGGTIRKFDKSGNDLGVFIGANIQGPTNIWFDPQGNLLVNDWQAGAIRRFNSSGAFLGNFTSGVLQVEGVDFLENGDIIVGVGATASIRQYTSTGTFVKDLVTGGLGGLAKPNAVRVRRPRP